jgi:hypothetical protein
MGRKAASPSTDRSVAEPARGDFGQARRRVARPCVADVAKIPHRAPHPAKQSHLTAIGVNKTCPRVGDDFPHPIPVLERELDAIEMYLGPLIDRMLQCKE